MPRAILLGLAILAAAPPGDVEAVWGMTAAYFAQHDVDTSFKCEIALDDYKGNHPFRLRIVAERKACMAPKGAPPEACLEQVYWADGQLSGPMNLEDRSDLVRRCGFARAAKRTSWPLISQIMQGTSPDAYVAMQVECAALQPQQIRLTGGIKHRTEVVCPLPDYLR
jgi:hypothetical protein